MTGEQSEALIEALDTIMQGLDKIVKTLRAGDEDCRLVEAIYRASSEVGHASYLVSRVGRSSLGTTGRDEDEQPEAAHAACDCDAVATLPRGVSGVPTDDEIFTLEEMERGERLGMPYPGRPRADCPQVRVPTDDDLAESITRERVAHSAAVA